MTFGSRASYATRRDEHTMKANIKQDDNFPASAPTSTARLHKQHLLIQRGNEYNTERAVRMGRQDLVTARLDEERQISNLTTARRPGLRGEGGRVRAA